MRASLVVKRQSTRILSWLRCCCHAPTSRRGHFGRECGDPSIAGQTSKTITFSATQDTVDDDDESVLLAFGTTLPAGVSEGSPSETTVSITDDDDPGVTVSFWASTYTAAEGGTATVTVTLSADPERTVEVRITTTNQGGASDSDYSGVPASITFNSGDTEKTITFTATADSLNESGERVKLSFGTLPAGVSEGTPAETTVTISDSTQAQITLPTIHFGSASYTVSEGGSVDVTVTLSKAPGSEAVIPLTASNQGRATASDYSGVPTSVTFGAAETSKTFTVTAGQDTVDDDGESILLGFGTLPGGITATTGQAAATTVSITDDDPQVTVSFGASTYTAAEGGTATVTVTLSADPERTVEVRITKTNQGGASAADYSGVPTSVTFDAGDTSKTFDFAATQDAEDDVGESVKLAFGALPTGVGAGATDETSVSISDDDDPAVTVSFGASTYTAAEGGTATVTVTLSADPERTVEVRITKTNQGGASAADYPGVPTSVTFDAGDTSKTFDFAATQDAEDDDGESVKLAFGALPTGVGAGATDETSVSISDDDDPAVTVSFGASTYTAAEGGTATVTVTLSADPERTVEVRITTTNQGGASASDYSGVPASVTFNAGETSKTITFSATQDTLDDDGESVDLGFGTSLPVGVSEGSPSETTVSIRDDDDPQVTVSFGASTYTAAEGGTATVTVTLSADPERTVEVRITKTNQGGASAADYSGVPTSVTFDAGDTSKTFDFAATADAEDDDGESVRLAFGTLPARVSEGSPNQATVTIKQVSTEFIINCSLVVWCADIRLSDGTAVDWGWSRLRYEKDWDPPATISDDTFTFRGVEYTFRRVDVHPGTYPTMPNAWSWTKQGYSYISLRITRGDYWDPPAEEHYRDWVLHLDGVELPFKDAFRAGDEFQWIGVAFQQLFNDWTSSTVTKFGIEEIPATEQEPTPALPYAPIHVEAWASGRDGLYVRWDPPWWRVGVPDATGYIVQWKKPDDSWSDSAAVSQREVRGGWQGLQKVDGLTEGTLYSVRVFATNAAGDGPPSEDTLGRPQPLNPHLVSMSVNGRTLTMRYDRQLDQTSVPAETAFVVLVNGGLGTVDAVAVRGMEVVLTLAQGVSAANSVIARYEPPTDPSAAFLRDTAGNHVFTSKRNWLQEVANETPGSSLQPLTASFSNVPSSHDGSGSFTFNIVFSEQVWIGTGFPRAQLLVVTVPPVTGAHWLDRRTGRWAVTIRPDGVGDIVITLPKDRYCVADLYDSIRQDDLVPGGPCAAGNRPLTNEPTATVPGPPPMQQEATENTQAEGAPRIQGDPDVGETLSADTTGITDADGLEGATFSYQWLADEAEIDGATGSTHTPTSGDAGKAIRVRVTFTDDAGNEESLTSAAMAAVSAGLRIRSATLDGATLTLTYNETLDEGGSIPGGAFTVTVAGSAREMTGVSVSGSSVTLTLASEAAAGDAVAVDYTRPEGRYFIRDTRGRVAPSFSGRVVPNDTAAGEQSTSRSQAPGSPRNLAVVRHASGKLRASWDAPDSGTTPTGYTVQWKESGDDWAEQADVSEAQVTGTSHVITGLTDGVEYAVRVIAYKEDAEGSPSGEVAVTPQETVPPSLSSAVVDGATLTVSFDEALDTNGGPDKTAFAVTVAGNDRGVDTVSVSGSIVTITLVTAVFAGDAVTVDYTAPTDQSAARLQDLAGNAAASLSGQDVSNNTQAADRLTASASGVPTSHDDHVTFELEFSEEFPLSYKTLRDHAFTVTGGDVSNARRLDPPSNQGWEIHVEPDGDGAVTIELPVTTDCRAEAAICTGDRRPLSSRLKVTVPGTGEAQQTPANSPATGMPTISGTAHVGETLTANTLGIADEDRLENASFSYQWLADDEAISGATGSSYTLADTGEGKTIRVRVRFTDDAGNEESLTSEATDAVAVPLTASLENTPDTHDGENVFTSELGFSEEFSLSYKVLRDHAFTVAGGTVTNAERIIKGSNLRWLITVRPDGDGQVAITLPVTEDCTALGAVCTGDGRRLCNRLELTVGGPGQ